MMFDTFAELDPPKNCELLISAFRRKENGDRLADYLFNGVAKKSRCPSIPRSDLAVQVSANNRVITRINNGCNSLRDVHSKQVLIGRSGEGSQIRHYT